MCYVSPELEVLDLKAEGVLCASGEGNVTVKDWVPSNGAIDF